MNQKLYRFDTAFYSIEFSEKYKGIAEADKALRKYYTKFIRMMNDKRFENISFGIGISNQDGQTATKATIKTGDKGRPQIIVIVLSTETLRLLFVRNLSNIIGRKKPLISEKRN